MTRRIALATAVAAVLCGSCANGEASGQDHQRQMREAVDGFFAAANRGKWDEAARFMAPEFKIFTDGASTFDRPTYVALLKADDLKVTDVGLSEIESSVSSDGSLGWIRYKALVKATSNGKPADVRTAETMVLARRPEGWRIVQAHASIAPLEQGRGR